MFKDLKNLIEGTQGGWVLRPHVCVAKPIKRLPSRLARCSMACAHPKGWLLRQITEGQGDRHDVDIIVVVVVETTASAAQPGHVQLQPDPNALPRSRLASFLFIEY
jgi:hypothetical protein